MYVLAKKFGNEKISGKDGFSEVPLTQILQSADFKFAAVIFVSLDGINQGSGSGDCGGVAHASHQRSATN